MGKWFQIINIDKKQTLGEWGKVGEWFFHDQSPCLVEHLAAPEKPLSEATAEKYLLNVTSTPRQSGILRLPNEILGLVFAEMNDIIDVMLFGVTCKLLLSISLTQLHALQVNIRAHWVGDRIICIGSGAWDGGLPEGLLTEAEIQDLGLDGQSGQDDLLEDHNLYNIAATYFCEPPVLPHIYEVFTAGNRDDHISLEAFPTRGEREILSRLHKPVYALEETWVLANLTKREYVRASSISDLKEFSPSSSKGPFVGRNLTLGSVLVHRICLPCDIPVCEFYDDTGGDTHHGVWVGDRFAITTISKLNQGKGEKEWKDISSEVIEEMIEMWKKEFNDDWENRL